MRILSLLSAASLLLAVFACSGGAASGSKATITADGSTALQPLVSAAAQDYMAKYPNVDIAVKGGGSAVGLTDAMNHAVDIGDSDVAGTDTDLVDHEVAIVAFTVVHGPNVGVESLTKAQIAGIFGGTIKNWKQVGGADQAVLLVNRPLGSGTRRVFTTYIMSGKDPAQIGATIDSSEDVARQVKNRPGAISYVGLSYAQKFNVPTIAIDGVAPTIANMRDGKYGFWSYEHMYTSKESAPQAEAFINYVRSDDGAIDQLGFIPIEDFAKR
ncbi:MAG TPA: phosphate ABC transporter substrate-binding protein [Verrucomicrobiae bacterium]|nr:phosphate ABC transporter substrate-binding protein [Verrucomicrobiae bacterium]